MSHPKILLPFCFFGNTDWFSHLVQHEVCIEMAENYPKRTDRARCTILGPQGPQFLQIPIDRTGPKDFKSIQIAQQEDWQRQHLKALRTNYKTAPFYEFFESDLERFYLRKFKFLFDLNEAALEWVQIALGRKWEFSYTRSFQKEVDMVDRRNDFKTSNFNSFFANPRYFQVFDQDGFVPSLSILDLIFNEGPASVAYLLNNTCIHGKNENERTRPTV